MFIDIHVHPAFYDPINGDEAVEEMRHSALDIHKNGTAPLEHIFNQMRCAGLDRLCLLPEDYTTELGRRPGLKGVEAPSVQTAFLSLR